MTLRDAKIQKEYKIKKLTLNQPIKQRLEAMGLIKGTVIRKINETLDGSIIFMVRGTRLAIGKDLANDIIIFEEGKVASNFKKVTKNQEITVTIKPDNLKEGTTNGHALQK